MRFRRSLLASLGAAISLIAAGSFALLAVSAVVAFNGWPTEEDDRREPRTAMLAVAPVPSSPAAREAARASIVLRRAPRATAVRSAVRRRAATSPAAAVERTAAAAPTIRTKLVPRAAPAPATPDAPAPTAKDKTTRSKPAEQVEQVTRDLGKTTNDGVDKLGDAVAPVSPALDKTLDQVGTAVQQTLDRVGTTVGQVVDGLVPPKK